MKARAAWNHSHPALALAGITLIVFGVAVLIGLAAMLYDERLNRELVLLGIPITLLSQAMGLAAVFTGAAVFAAGWAPRRRKSR